MTTDPFMHPSAIVDAGAKIGAGTKIWHWVHVSSEAQIGTNCSLGQNVFVASRVIIGNNVRIQNNVSIFEGVSLEDDVFCGPSMVFTNVTNPRSAVNRRDEFKETVVKKGATLGANCTILCGTTIGEYAFIGAGAVVTSDVHGYALMVGVPARQVGWMSKHGERLDLQIDGDGEAVCAATGERYVLSDGIVRSTEA